MKQNNPELAGELGDIPPDVFRKHLHEVADWIADYRENIAKYRISPTAKPGAIKSPLPAAAPETAEPLAQILADVDRLIVPGIAHWAHPQFMGYFGCTTTAPGILAEMMVAAWFMTRPRSARCTRSPSRAKRPASRSAPWDFPGARSCPSSAFTFPTRPTARSTKRRSRSGSGNTTSGK